MSNLGSVRLRDMALTRQEQKEMEGPVDYDSPSYPYGLRLSLDEDAIAKLGIDLPDVGESFVVVGIGTVVSVSQDKRENRTNQRLEVQLEKLAFESREETVSLRTEE